MKKSKLKKYYLSLWPNNQPPIDCGYILAYSKYEATIKFKEILDYDRSSLDIMSVDRKNIAL